jgi:broad specificity phosphatase PhoE
VPNPSPFSNRESAPDHTAAAAVASKAPAGELLCVRHGLTEWNASFRWQGRADIALTDEGVQQARRGAASLKNYEPGFDILVCSPLQRARHTAEIIGEQIGLPISVVDERWAERDIGEWSGHTTAEIEAKWPGMLNAWRNDGVEQLPGGEHESHMTQRTTQALEELLQTLNGRRALVVAHGGVLHTLSSAYGVRPRPFDNLEGRWFSWAREHRRVKVGPAVTLDRHALRRKSNAL